MLCYIFVMSILKYPVFWKIEPDAQKLHLLQNCTNPLEFWRISKNSGKCTNSSNWKNFVICPMNVNIFVLNRNILIIFLNFCMLGFKCDSIMWWRKRKKVSLLHRKMINLWKNASNIVQFSIKKSNCDVIEHWKNGKHSFSIKVKIYIQLESSVCIVDYIYMSHCWC